MSTEPDAQTLTFIYRNWKGEVGVRRVIPDSIRFGATEWHPEPQWLMRAFDLDKNAVRDFALKDMTRAPQAAPELPSPTQRDIVERLLATELPKCSFDDGKTWELDGVVIAETFSEAAAEISRLRSQLAPNDHNAKPALIATLEGGCLTAIVSNETSLIGRQFTKLDYDVEGLSPEDPDLVRVTQPDGCEVNAYIESGTIEKPGIRILPAGEDQ